MRSVGLESKEKRHVNSEEDPVPGGQSWLWQFDRDDWATAKEGMVQGGKWPL